MFKNLAADMLGLSDIGKIIDPADFDKADIDDYIFNEDNEKIIVLIKSKIDEYCFTNLAVMHLDGNIAISKKRTLNRYPYKHYPISKVRLETAGTVDLDVELKFNIGDKEISIDIDKKQIEKVKDIYKALFSISEKFKEMQMQMNTLQQTQDAVSKMFCLKELPEQMILNLPDIINETVSQVDLKYTERRREIQNFDFGAIYKRYLEG
jgi:Bacterial PH domain